MSRLEGKEDQFGGCEAKAISKRYCLRPDLKRQAELYRVGSRQNETPKKDLRLPFSLVTFFWSKQKKVTGVWGDAL